MAEKSVNQLREGLRAHFNDRQLACLASASIGIAGAGGLGSNVAMLLARCGVENMLLIDDDEVCPSNLNRQHFWPRHVGQKKIMALAQSLRELNPDISLELLPLRLTPENLEKILPRRLLWVEALDDAGTKAMFVECALLAQRKVFAASGLCGAGGPPMQKRRLGNLVVVGDFLTGLHCAPPYAPRVMQAAALMADCILETLLGEAIHS